MNKNLRVLMLPEVVGGEPWGLAEGLRSLGDEVTVVSKRPHPYGYRSNRVICPREASGRLETVLRTLLAGIYVFQRWDVIHFTFGRTLLDPGNTLTTVRDVRSLIRRLFEELGHGLQVLELAILKLRHIPVFFHFQGDDVRQGGVLLARYPVSIAHVVRDGYYTEESDAAKRRRVKRFARWSDGMFAVNPDLLWVLPDDARFIPYAAVNVEEYEPSLPSANNGPLVVAHAPSHRGAKGTNLIINAIDTLQTKGVNIELDLIEGVSNLETIERIKKCDFLIDQLFAGWYGGVAVEAMSLCKPVVCFIREDDLQWISPQMVAEIPILNTSADSIFQTLRELSAMEREEFDNLGITSREFAKKWHNRLEIARNLRTLYIDAIEQKKHTEKS